MQNMKYLKRVLMFSDCAGCEVCRCIADLAAETLISRLCGSSAFVLASIQPVAFLQHPLAIMSMFFSTHLRLYKWKHVGTARDSEWLLLDQNGQVFFVRRTKTQRLAIGAQGSWAMQNGRLHLKEFACTPGATLRDHDFSVVKAEHYVDGKGDSFTSLRLTAGRVPSHGLPRCEDSPVTSGSTWSRRSKKKCWTSSGAPTSRSTPRRPVSGNCCFKLPKG